MRSLASAGRRARLSIAVSTPFCSTTRPMYRSLHRQSRRLGLLGRVKEGGIDAGLDHGPVIGPQADGERIVAHRREQNTQRPASP